MQKKSILPLIRELVRCYQAFESLSARHIRTLDLTPPQFDIVATLGNTDGMSFKQLGEKTLITKGTLTGVVDRLALKRLVCRVASPTDGRSQIVRLTRKGETLFANIFPAHVGHLQRVCEKLGTEDLRQTEIALRNLRDAFEQVLEEA
ncbi:MAG: MarR family transcriptional regulator [Sterolibacterium sp.]